MTKFQNIKFFVICRHKLNIPPVKIYKEIKSLFGDNINRSIEDSVDRWIQTYTQETNQNKRDYEFSYSRRNKFAYDHLLFQLTSSTESNSIQKKKFYALCRFQLEQNVLQICQEINDLFCNDALVVLNQWIQENWKIAPSNLMAPYNQIDLSKLNVEELESKCLNLIILQMNLNQKLEDCKQELNELRKENELLTQDKQRLDKKQQINSADEINLAKKYWENNLTKLNNELSDLKSANSAMDCNLYKLKNDNSFKDNEISNLKMELKKMKNFYDDQIVLLQKHSDDSLFSYKESFLNLTDKVKFSEALNTTLNNRIRKLACKNKCIKQTCFKRVQRTSKLISLNRVKLREVFYLKMKYLIKQNEKQQKSTSFIIKSIKSDYSEKIFKLNEQLKSTIKQSENFFYPDDVKDVKTLIGKVKVEKRDPLL